MKLLVLFIFLSFTPLYSFLDELRAVKAYDKGDYKNAKNILQKELIDAPHDPQILYNLGTVSYKEKDFDKALTYFEQAARKSSNNKKIQTQALYNAGNSYVQKKRV